MNFKKEIIDELGLAVVSGIVLLDDYVSATEKIAKKYHKMEVEKLEQASKDCEYKEAHQSFKSFQQLNYCPMCGVKL